MSHWLVGQVTVVFPSLLAGFVFVIAVRYWRIWLRSNKTSWKGLLPLHVGVIAVSYLILMGMEANEVRNLFESEYGSDEFWWKFGLSATAEVMGLIAMSVMFGVGRHSEGVARTPDQKPGEHRG